MEQRGFSELIPKASFQGPTDIELEAIIREGDVQVLTVVAERMGRELAKSMTTSQIRTVFGAVRQIQLNWSADSQKAFRQMMLLKPRLAYQGARHGKGVEDLGAVLSAGVDLVGRDRTRFQHFVEFFEAVLAYHIAAGGR